MVQSFRDLTVWQKAMTLTERVYKATEKFPKTEMFGLTSQMRRASVSIPSNIAEGKAISGRGYPKHLRIALGSEAELQTHIELSVRLEMLAQVDGRNLIEETSEVGRMLSGLLQSVTRPDDAQN
jgi:four helix bundle protein